MNKIFFSITFLLISVPLIRAMEQEAVQAQVPENHAKQQARTCCSGFSFCLDHLEVMLNTYQPRTLMRQSQPPQKNNQLQRFQQDSKACWQKIAQSWYNAHTIIGKKHIPLQCNNLESAT